MPPSMMGSAPAVKADSSEARKTTASAISFGEPRPSGIWRQLAFQDRRRRGDRARQGLALRQAIAGLGITLLPMFLAGGAIKSKRLRVIEIGMQAEAEYIADPDGRRPSAKLTALADHLRTAFGTPPYWEAAVDLALQSARSRRYSVSERMVELRHPRHRRSSISHGSAGSVMLRSWRQGARLLPASQRTGGRHD
jgi:hypothetical protein